MNVGEITAFAFGAALLVVAGWAVWPAKKSKIEKPSAENNWRRIPERADHTAAPGTFSIPPETYVVPFSTDSTDEVYH